MRQQTNVGVTALQLHKKLGNILSLFFVEKKNIINCAPMLCLFCFFIGSECRCLFVYLCVSLRLGAKTTEIASSRTTYLTRCLKHDKTEHSRYFAMFTVHRVCPMEHGLSVWRHKCLAQTSHSQSFLWIYHLHSRDSCVSSKAIGEARSKSRSHWYYRVLLWRWACCRTIEQLNFLIILTINLQRGKCNAL